MLSRPSLFGKASLSLGGLWPASAMRLRVIGVNSPNYRRLARQSSVADVDVFDHFIARDAAPNGSAASPFFFGLAIESRLQRSAWGRE